MKTAIVGCGALGSYYGARLCRAGYETHFLLRSDFEQVSRDGVLVLGGASGLVDWRVRPVAARRPEEIGVCDLVLIGLKTTANDVLPGLLPALTGAHTRVLTLQNGLGNEAALARIVSADQVFGGLAYVSLNRVAPGVVRCLDEGSVVVGAWGQSPPQRLEEVVEALAGAGVRTTACASLPRERWKKLVWNIPFNGLCTLGTEGIESLLLGHPLARRGDRTVVTTDQILTRPAWRSLVRELLGEVIRAAQILGYDLPDDLAESELLRTEGIGAYLPSTAVDYSLGRELELEAIFLEPLRQIQARGIHLPRWVSLCQRLMAGLGTR